MTGQMSGVFASEFGVMADEELDDLFNKSKYISSSADVDKFEKISTTEGKREFLTIFGRIGIMILQHRKMILQNSI